MNVELDRTHAKVISRNAIILKEVINVIALKTKRMEKTKMEDVAIKMNVPQIRPTYVTILIELAQIIQVVMFVRKSV